MVSGELLSKASPVDADSSWKETPCPAQQRGQMSKAVILNLGAGLP